MVARILTLMACAQAHEGVSYPHTHPHAPTSLLFDFAMGALFGALVVGTTVIVVLRWKSERFHTPQLPGMKQGPTAAKRDRQ